jgi:hypothetical protein
MNEQHDPHQETPPIDATRRRLTKAGLAAPAVLGVLASRPVLGASFHQCTPSGHISGFASANNQEACTALGNPPSFYATQPPTSWPNATADWITVNPSGNVTPRDFDKTPASLTFNPHSPLTKFLDAFARAGTASTANVLEVLQGNASVKSGYSATVSLGQEAIAACMNATLNGGAGGHPLTVAEIVNMFNSVAKGGTYKATSTANWNVSEVVEYLQSLHT